ncbi:hypothetical protein HOM50_03225 [bacterium]|jgi:hypothetical protein|nr:hypothetical protein [bacterium]MBT5015388.1 hypothetical protein [bacterium]
MIKFYTLLIGLLAIDSCFSIPDITDVADTVTFGNFVINNRNVTRVFGDHKTLEDASRSLFSNFSLLDTACAIKSKFKLLSLLSVAPASYISYLVIRANRLMHNEGKWTNWKGSLSLETLLAQPIDTIGQDLLGEISIRYKDPQTELNIAHAFIIFAKDIKSELTLLKRYIKAIKLMKRLKLDKVLPFDELLEQKAHDAILKLNFLQNAAAQAISPTHQ